METSEAVPQLRLMQSVARTSNPSPNVFLSRAAPFPFGYSPPNRRAETSPVARQRPVWTSSLACAPIGEDAFRGEGAIKELI